MRVLVVLFASASFLLCYLAVVDSSGPPQCPEDSKWSNAMKKCVELLSKKKDSECVGGKDCLQEVPSEALEHCKRGYVYVRELGQCIKFGRIVSGKDATKAPIIDSIGNPKGKKNPLVDKCWPGFIWVEKLKMCGGEILGTQDSNDKDKLACKLGEDCMPIVTETKGPCPKGREWHKKKKKCVRPKMIVSATHLQNKKKRT